VSILDRLILAVEETVGWVANRLAEVFGPPPAGPAPGVQPDPVAGTPPAWEPDAVIDPDLIVRWVRHADRLSSKDLQIATYVHVRILEETVADLTQAVADLQRAVTDVAGRVGPTVAQLQQALADSQAASAALQTAMDRAAAEDVTEDAEFNQEISDLQAQLDAANSAANDAAGQIAQSVAQLDQIATVADTTPPDTTGTGDTGNLPPSETETGQGDTPEPTPV
jgi:uncharacterized phage infection (PIP) family protein YhgE